MSGSHDPKRGQGRRRTAWARLAAGLMVSAAWAVPAVVASDAQAAPAGARKAAAAARTAAAHAEQSRKARGAALRYATPERPDHPRVTVRRAAFADAAASGARGPVRGPRLPRNPGSARDGAGLLGTPMTGASPVDANDDALAARWLPEKTVLPTLSALDLTLRPSRDTVAMATADDAAPRRPPPQPPNAGYQQMQALLRAAAERNAAIRDIQATVRATEQDIKEASGARLPQVTLDVTSRYSSGAGDNQTSSQRGTPYYSVTSTMPVYDFGRIGNIVESRSASRRAAEARLDGAMETLALETSLAALEVGRLRLAVSTADGYLRNVTRLVDMLVAITREDPGRSGELTQTRSRQLQAQVSRDALASKLREAEIALRRLIGDANLPIDALGAAFQQVPPLPALLQDLPTQPVLRQLDAEREAQSSLARSIASARRPQVSAVVSRAPVAPGVVNGYGSYAGITVSVPLFRGQSDVAAQRAAEERAAGAGERRQQGETDLVARLRTLHESATALLGRAPEFAALLRESDQVRRGFFEQWYQMGRRSLFELLAAESEHYALMSAHLNTLYDGLQTSARLRSEAGALAAWLGEHPSADTSR